MTSTATTSRNDIASGMRRPAYRSRRGDARHSIRSYVIGLALAAALTVASFASRPTQLIWAPAIPVALVVLAIAQMGVHLVFFLHITTAPDNTNNVAGAGLRRFIVLLIFAGSLWIMAHLDARMMPMSGIRRDPMRRPGSARFPYSDKWRRMTGNGARPSGLMPRRGGVYPEILLGRNAAELQPPLPKPARRRSVVGLNRYLRTKDRDGFRISRTTPSSATARRPRWLAATARSTGSAGRASTPAPALRRCSAGPTWPLADRAGRAGSASVTRRYRRDTLILETTFETADGAVTLIDFMPPRGRPPDLVRLVRASAGRVAMRTELVLRFDYGSLVPWVTRLDDGDAAGDRRPRHGRPAHPGAAARRGSDDGRRIRRRRRARPCRSL